jgi:ribonuclease P protein component
LQGAQAAITTAKKHPALIGSSPYRFHKDNRLLDAAAYGRVFKKAARSKDKWFTVLCRDNGSRAARLGLAISKKHCRAATTRNRIKRIVREAFRHNQATLAGLDVIVINQPAARAGNNRQLFDSLHGHWQRCESTRADQGAQE